MSCPYGHGEYVEMGISGSLVVLLQLKRGGVSKAKGEGEKKKECTAECKSRRRRDEKVPWALTLSETLCTCVLLTSALSR